MNVLKLFNTYFLFIWKVFITLEIIHLSVINNKRKILIKLSKKKI